MVRPLSNPLVPVAAALVPKLGSDRKQDWFGQKANHTPFVSDYGS
jgi:hypothetical protein